jgi:hypothetical protein
MEDLYNSLAGVPGLLTRRRGCVIRTPYALGLLLYVIHEEAGGIPVSDNYYPTLQPVAVLHLILPP